MCKLLQHRPEAYRSPQAQTGNRTAPAVRTAEKKDIPKSIAIFRTAWLKTHWLVYLFRKARNDSKRSQLLPHMASDLEASLVFPDIRVK